MFCKKKTKLESLTAFSHHHKVHPISRICPHLKVVSQIVHPILPESPIQNTPLCWSKSDVEGLMHQSFPPDVIVVWIGSYLCGFSLKKIRFYSQSNQWKDIFSGQSLKNKHAFLRIKFDFSLCCHLWFFLLIQKCDLRFFVKVRGDCPKSWTNSKNTSLGTCWCWPWPTSIWWFSAIPIG